MSKAGKKLFVSSLFARTTTKTRPCSVSNVMRRKFPSGGENRRSEAPGRRGRQEAGPESQAKVKNHTKGGGLDDPRRPNMGVGKGVQNGSTRLEKKKKKDV